MTTPRKVATVIGITTGLVWLALVVRGLGAPEPEWSAQARIIAFICAAAAAPRRQ